MKSVLILGAGAAGCAVAHQLALQGGWSVTVLERAPFSGAGIRTQWYAGHPYTFGPRHFLTKSDAVWKYMQQYCPLNDCSDHEFHTLVPSDAAFYNFPVHRDDIERMPEAQEIRKELLSLSSEEPTNLEEFWVRSIGRTLFNKFIGPYNRKMWRMESRLLDTFKWSPKGSPIKSGKRAAWTNTHSGYPQAPDGYDQWLAICLAEATVHYNCKITSFDLERRRVKANYDQLFEADIIVSTLSPDILRWFCFGKLPYIGRDFHKILLPIEFALPEHVYFTYEGGDEAWTRLTEYKKFTRHKSPHTLLSIEIPSDNGKHYPIPTLEAQRKARRYIEGLPHNIYSVGRSGTYRYEVDIAVCIETAIALAETLKSDLPDSHPVPLARLR